MPLDYVRSVADWLVCKCGNEPHLDGFYPCLEDGTPVEPTPQLWKKNIYICARCFSVYDIDTFDQLGVGTGEGL